jgi:hypothetical protein
MLAGIFEAKRVVFKALTCIIYLYVTRKSETLSCPTKFGPPCQLKATLYLHQLAIGLPQ